MTEITRSPLPKKSGSSNPPENPPTPKVLMSFPDAVAAIIRGEKVTKAEWNNEDTYVYLDSFLKIHLNGADHSLVVSDEDMRGEDWYIIEGS